MPFGRISKDKGIPEISASTTLTPIGEGVLTALELRIGIGIGTLTNLRQCRQDVQIGHLTVGHRE